MSTRAQIKLKDSEAGVYLTGWGIDCVQHDDIEYLYEIDEDKIYINGKLFDGDLDV